jgi:glutamine synthetase
VSQPQGMLTREELADRVDRGEIETVLTVFPDLYGRLLGKRLDARFFLDETAEGGTHACDYLLTVDMEMEPVAGYPFAGWEQGYGDVHLVPDLPTLRVASWLDRSALVIADVHTPDHEPASIAPRTILRRQVDRVAAAGYEVRAGSELEYYLFHTSYTDAAASGYRDLQHAGWYLEDYHTLIATRDEQFNAAARRHLRDSGIPVEGSKGEWGVGQHELNVRHAEVFEMADRHAIYKHALKDIAAQLELSVSFMAKVDGDRAGSGCHLNISLWHGETNAFARAGNGAAQDWPDTFRWFLGGWIAHAAELMVCFAPTVNSYKRYRSGSWAPTGLAWAIDNRTAGFRALGEGAAARIEFRVPGADCNPYLAYAAALAAGLDGIERRTEPPPVLEGDAYAAGGVPALPASLAEATDRFEHGDFARSVFGPDVVEHYTRFFRVEQEAFDRAVTDWERQRYFERI